MEMNWILIYAFWHPHTHTQIELQIFRFIYFVWTIFWTLFNNKQTRWANLMNLSKKIHKQLQLIVCVCGVQCNVHFLDSIWQPSTSQTLSGADQRRLRLECVVASMAPSVSGDIAVRLCSMRLNPLTIVPNGVSMLWLRYMLVMDVAAAAATAALCPPRPLKNCCCACA